MTSREHNLKNKARQQAREILGNSPGFRNMNRSEQLQMYKDVYNSAFAQLVNGNGADHLAAGMARRRREIADDLIDPESHRNRRIEQAGELAGEFIREVDFPGFVSSLLEGVFEANLDVTLQQMETYQELLKAASTSVSKFVRDIDNTAAFGYLAENQGDDFSFDFDDDNKDENGNSISVLKDKDGNIIATSVDIGDNEVKAKIMEAKIAMAKEHRAMLREMILMGVTRLVVEKGTVKASVLFDMKASEKINRDSRAGIRDQVTTSKHRSSNFFGFKGGGRTRTRQRNVLTVSSVKSQQDTSLAAQMAGSVELIFKSDYFKLDNFAAMYSPEVTEEDKRQVEGQNG